jgi:hypothetical protein
VIAGFLSVSVQLWLQHQAIQELEMLQHQAIQELEIKIDAIRELLFRFV